MLSEKAEELKKKINSIYSELLSNQIKFVYPLQNELNDIRKLYAVEISPYIIGDMIRDTRTNKMFIVTKIHYCSLDKCKISIAKIKKDGTPYKLSKLARERQVFEKLT